MAAATLWGQQNDAVVSMIRALLWRIYSWPVVRRMARWRRDLLFYVFTREKENLVFFSLSGAFVVLLCSLVYFAYTDHVRAVSAQQGDIELACLARNIYFEARGESTAGQHAVAEVTMNRVASKKFPNTVCDVVYEKRWDRIRKRYVGAFSWTELDVNSRGKGIAWQRAVASAQAVFDGQQAPTVHGALFYHADSIEPRWAKTKQRVAKIGHHIFYE